MWVFGQAENSIDCLGFALLRQVEMPSYSTLKVSTKPKGINRIVYDSTQGNILNSSHLKAQNLLL